MSDPYDELLERPDVIEMSPLDLHEGMIVLGNRESVRHLVDEQMPEALEGDTFSGIVVANILGRRPIDLVWTKSFGKIVASIFDGPQGMNLPLDPSEPVLVVVPAS